MALYTKQDFTPPILSRRWIAIKFRPNMLLYSRHHVISILESGLLFREDSIEVEQETPSAEEVRAAAGGGTGGWLTRGERVTSLFAVAAFIMTFPPKSLQRSTLAHVAACAALPACVRVCHRVAARGCLAALLAAMRDYLALARRAAACLRECAALRAELASVSSVLESTHTMLCRQQSELGVVMSRASSSLLGNAPWLRGDVAWDAVPTPRDSDLLKIHHAFLVVQSTLLKHIAMAHYIPSAHAQKIYKNHNERIYWIHNVLIKHLTEEFQSNFDTLERMYRLLKNYGNSDNVTNKKPGTALHDTWLYSEVHSGIAKANLELKLALNKCNNLDMLLDSCAINKQELDLVILNTDIDNLIDNVTKCLTTVQSSQLRLKKLQNKFGDRETQLDKSELIEVENDDGPIKIDDKTPETKDEVYYFIKTGDDDVETEPIGDISTGPGKKERDATKIVLSELKRKLVRREDVMRERERQALVKTMPELRDNLPEFPRQIPQDITDRKGFLSKLIKSNPKRKLFRNYLIKSQQRNKTKKYRLKTNRYTNESDILTPYYEANSKFREKSNLLTFNVLRNCTMITKWVKEDVPEVREVDSSGMSEGLSDVEAGTVNRVVHQAVNLRNGHQGNGEAKNFRFTKQQLELSPSSSDSDFELYMEKHNALLNDVRRYRAARRKNHPVKRATVTPDRTIDEGLRPVEYSFGTGLAMASVLRVNNNARLPNMAREEVFIGDGEVSGDSGNDEDA